MPLFLLALLLPGCFLNGSVGVSSMDEGDDVDGDFDCGDGGLEAGFVDTLEEPSGCQYRITALGPDVRLVLDSTAFADALTEGSGSGTYTLPDDNVLLEVETGCNLDAGVCGEDGTAVVDNTFVGSAGTITISATRDEASGTDGGYEAWANVTFTDVVLEDEEGNLLAIDALGWEGVRLYGL
ncbi:MAG: hypothetical protein Q8P41_12585 [Pseudomonadota bacterium]|nr:hypothetical protein [Pseudomonadota bacterium]